MGTSGAYGGSGSQSWAEAQDAVAGLPATGNPSSAQVRQTAQKIAAAIHRLNPSSLASHQYNYNAGDILGRRSAAGGGITSGRTRSTSGGAMSASSAARGGAVLWAGHAQSQADLDALGVGLRFEDMKAMSQSDRCRYILDCVLGPPGSPDEEVLRRSSLEALKELAADPDRTIDESVNVFMSTFIYESALVELTSHKAAQKLTPDEVLKHEKDLKQYIRGQTKYSNVTDGARMSAASFMNTVAKFRDKALNFLRKAIR